MNIIQVGLYLLFSSNFKRNQNIFSWSSKSSTGLKLVLLCPVDKLPFGDKGEWLEAAVRIKCLPSLPPGPEYTVCSRKKKKRL